jgi:aspartate aminotransferase-like enzyme
LEEGEVTKITHTSSPMITSSGFIPDESTRLNDEAFKKMQARKHEKREQALDLMMLLSALESWAFSLGKTPPDYLIERMDKAIDMLRAEVLEDVK